MSYVINVLIAIDQLGTALVGGYPDETLSSYAYRLDQQGKVAGRIFRPVIDFLFFWQKKHCFNAYVSERMRYQFAPEMRLDPEKTDRGD